MINVSGNAERCLLHSSGFVKANFGTAQRSNLYVDGRAPEPQTLATQDAGEAVLEF